MFEIGVISIVVLAVGYWVTLWLMGRHDDVLHGDFVHTEDGAETAAMPSLSAQSFPPPPFPKKPQVVKPAAVRPAAMTPARSQRPSAPPPRAATPPEQSDTLQTLLASIKRDLKDASQL